MSNHHWLQHYTVTSHASLSNSFNGEFGRFGSIRPWVLALFSSSSTKRSILFRVTLGITTTWAMSSSHASCHLLINTSSTGRSRTTVELKSLRRQEMPELDSLSRKYLAVSIQCLHKYEIVQDKRISISNREKKKTPDDPYYWSALLTRHLSEFLLIPFFEGCTTCKVRTVRSLIP